MRNRGHRESGEERVFDRVLAASMSDRRILYSRGSGSDVAWREEEIKQLVV